MRFDGKWTRRSLLGAAVAAVGVGMYVSTSGRSWGGSRSASEAGVTFRELLLRTVAGLDVPCNSGEVFLSTEAGERERDVSGLVASLENTLRTNSRPEEGDYPEGWPDMDADGLARQLSEAVKEDFSKDELCIVDGWQLSRTECRLAALKFLREREQAAGGAMACRKELLRSSAPPPQLSGIVPPRTFAGGEGGLYRSAGRTVINVYGTGFESGAEILLGGTPLRSSVARSDWMTGSVPAGFYAREGILDVVVRNPDGKTSNVMKFEVVRLNE